MTKFWRTQETEFPAQHLLKIYFYILPQYTQLDTWSGMSNVTKQLSLQMCHG